MVKSAGEHWVCSVLSRLDWGVALTRDGLERTDLLAVQTTGSRGIVEIQVKAATDAGANTKFALNAKTLQPAVSDREWFVFVVVPQSLSTAPRSYVVPRDHVSAAQWLAHMEWLTDPAIPAGRRNTQVTNTRINGAAWTGYENRWDLLTAPSTAAPVLLPEIYRDWAQTPRVGLPPNHPWQAALPKW